MNKKSFITGFSILILVILTGAGIYFNKMNNQKTYSAIIYPEAESYVKAMAEGNVKEVLVKPNEQVSKGQVLAVMEAESKESVKPVAEPQKINLTQMKSKLDKAEENYKNAALMYKDGVITQDDYDERLTTLKDAQSAYKTAVYKSKANPVQQVKKQPVSMKVFSPMDGVVNSTFVKSGDLVKSGDNMMLLSMKNKKVTAYVDKEASLKIKTGQGVLISVPGYEPKKFNGVVERVDNNPVTIADIAEPVYPVSISFDSKVDSSKFNTVGNVAVVFVK